MKIEEYKQQIESGATIDMLYLLLSQAVKDDDVDKAGYLMINRAFLRAKADFDRLEREEEIFVEPTEVDIKEIVIAALWKADDFTTSGKTGIIKQVKVSELEKWLKERLKK